MEICINEWIRTKTGNITKVYKVKDTVVWTDEFLDPFGKYHEGIVEETDIAKHSKNIIDLIQEGDYVNGEKVISVDWGSIGFKGFDFINPEDIKSIVTKEQFSSVEYLFEENLYRNRNKKRQVDIRKRKRI